MPEAVPRLIERFPGHLTDVAGLRVGHHTLPGAPTGCSVVLCPPGGAVCGADVRGAAPGTRETDLLHSDNLVDRVHALLLSGGSAFGLDAAGGVMRWLEAQGHGLPVGPARVPIVPAAVLFDLWLAPTARPDAAAGWAACEAASSQPEAEGCVGAGTGATVGKLFGIGRAMKGGIGSASLQAHGVTVAAMVAVNAIGDVIDPATGQPLAGARTGDGMALQHSARSIVQGLAVQVPATGSATTLGIVATDAVLTKPQANRLATVAHDGLARSINPVHTASDGDTLFALATGTAAAAPPMSVLGTLAAEVVARAVLNAVRAATGLPGLPAWRELG
ncbi:P1 family peptidase [Aquincola sp. J276]|uniref:P1 family peptidase n=1 Tax=Aquincola sp. J276 TaxID=2898432 RepID=UPI002151C935|nr:P1 family peptidase [Aquincola sp. J276]MCR5865031.1 P1 family peptidase [Aquincola sp. J276]